MKNIIIFLIVIILIIGLTIFIVHYSHHSFILLDSSSYSNINGIFVGDTININNKSDVKKVIDYINSLKKKRTIYYHQTNKTPDISLSLIRDDKNVDDICFYGIYMVYNNSQYIVDYYEIYDEFEELIFSCK